MNDYEWLTQMGLCHKCRKNKAAPDRKYCFDCLEKIKEINAKRYDSEKAKEYQARRREIYNRKKEEGICVRCNKKATQGMYCLECHIKVKRQNEKKAERRKAERHERGLVPEWRIKNCLCLRCASALSEKDRREEYKICHDCRDKLADARGRNNNHPWRKIESARYEENRRWRDEHIQTAVQEAN